MTKRKEKVDQAEVAQEVAQEVIENTTEPAKKEVKKEIKPLISDVEVAKKLVNIHSSAQSRNLEFNLTFECVKKLLEYNTCYYTNVQFTEEGAYARSFDRVDNEKGYVVGNVVACTVDINGKKNNLSIDEIVCLYKKLAYLKK
jgi:negative regulator of genetic competence, sporulation and motility